MHSHTLPSPAAYFPACDDEAPSLWETSLFFAAWLTGPSGVATSPRTGDFSDPMDDITSDRNHYISLITMCLSGSASNASNAVTCTHFGATETVIYGEYCTESRTAM